ncbi:MAG TPA: pyruvate, phosphate dikinase [Thermopetrobacter sp.]|nr:pyruvate, phosphate dikinase [Thermopetrobacter sp.]
MRPVAGATDSAIWFFGGDGATEGPPPEELLGGKGAGLVRMSRLGLPVPPGFIITTEAARALREDGAPPPELERAIDAALDGLQAASGRRLGDAQRPLLLAVRSGAAQSMPGMMETLLDVGINPATAAAMAGDDETDGRFAWDCLRRFAQGYGQAVRGLPAHLFDEEWETWCERAGGDDAALSADDLRDMALRYLELIHRETGRPLPSDPRRQLKEAIIAVARSWESEKARAWRALHDVADDVGTAVIVQAMVFGNRDAASASGVAFSRDPSTGQQVMFGEYLPAAQGIDVVEGLRTPLPISEAMRRASGLDVTPLERLMPDAFAELRAHLRQVEAHHQAVQEVEFAIERGRLWLLQTRDARLSAAATVRVLRDMAAEGLIGRRDAIARLDPVTLERLLHARVDEERAAPPIARGLPASPGAVCGQAAFSVGEALRLKVLERDVVLIRPETSPDDVRGIHAARGVLTSRGGMTSHAAVIARGLNMPCVTAADIAIDEDRGEMTASGVTIRRGDWITIDGASGRVYAGRAPLRPVNIDAPLATLLGWADEVRRLRVRANADTAGDIAAARDLKAEGVGLLRIEWMFLDDDGAALMQRMILAADADERQSAAARLRRLIAGQLEGVLRAGAARPLTLRLLDLPLAAFLPADARSEERCAAALGVTVAALHERLERLQVESLRLGLRGARLYLDQPWVLQTQLAAIFDALAAVADHGPPPELEILVPMVMGGREFAQLRGRIDATATRMLPDALRDSLPVGAMIELPRAAIRAAAIAAHADFLSFGTNDLTRAALGLRREEAAEIAGLYVENALMNGDPFMTLDEHGVGALMRYACGTARRARPDIVLAVCGDHAADPASIAAFAAMDMDYISCAPPRLPVARLAAARAAV